MPRKGPAARREVPPDTVFGSEVVARFINKVMLDGRKQVAERIFYGAMQRIQERGERSALQVLQRATANVTPTLEVRPRRIGGHTYQVPIEVTARRQLTLAIRWIVGEARKRNERTMIERLANELSDAAEGQGGAVRRREEMYRMAEANKAYAHYRW